MTLLVKLNIKKLTQGNVDPVKYIMKAEGVRIAALWFDHIFMGNEKSE